MHSLLLAGLDSLASSMYSTLTFPGVEEFQMEDQINTLVIVEEQWTKLEQTVWKKPCQHPTRPELELTVWKIDLADTRLAVTMPNSKYKYSVFMLVLISDFAIRYGLGYNLGNAITNGKLRDFGSVGKQTSESHAK